MWNTLTTARVRSTYTANQDPRAQYGTFYFSSKEAPLRVPSSAPPPCASTAPPSPAPAPPDPYANITTSCPYLASSLHAAGRASRATRSTRSCRSARAVKVGWASSTLPSSLPTPPPTPPSAAPPTPFTSPTTDDITENPPADSSTADATALRKRTACDGSIRTVSRARRRLDDRGHGGILSPRSRQKVVRQDRRGPISASAHGDDEPRQTQDLIRYLSDRMLHKLHSRWCVTVGCGILKFEVFDRPRHARRPHDPPSSPPLPTTPNLTRFNPPSSQSGSLLRLPTFWSS